MTLKAPKFTDISIRNMKPCPTRREIPDPGARGLYVVIQPSGIMPIMMRGTELRDPLDEQWTRTDEHGRFTVYPEGNEYWIAALHPAGFVLPGWHCNQELHSIAGHLRRMRRSGVPDCRQFLRTQHALAWRHRLGSFVAAP